MSDPSDNAAGGTRRVAVRALVVVACTVAVAFLAFVGWALTPLGPSPEALAALESGDGIVVTSSDAGWIFAPADASENATTGLVFYPGGRVDARSYAPFARELSAQGHVVAIARMPLSLAVFAPDAADEFIDGALPAVKRWAVGGHSLGGVMAARYAAGNPDDIAGVLLLASYVDDSTDLSRSSVSAADVTATNDAVLDRDAWSAAQVRLPEATEHSVIEGGNHSQFGDYGTQRGDDEATISIERQRELTAEAAHRLLARIGRSQ